VTAAATKVSLVTAALIAAVIVAQWIILTVYAMVVQLTVDSGVSGALGPAVGLGLLQVILEAVFFGIGVFVSFRFIAPIHADDLWRKVIIRGIIATAVGALAALVFGFVVSLIMAIGPNSEFFGYALNIQFTGQPYIVGVLERAIDPLVTYVPLVVLAAVLQRLWLSRPPSYS
jgi:hypothetical protein